MKHRFYMALAAFAFTSGFALVQPSFAEGNADGGKAKGHGKGHEACERILEACKQHGFIKGQWKKDNGLYKDCFDPIIKGGNITQDGKAASVSVSQGDIQACREHKEHEKEHKQEHQHQGQTNPGTGK
jgi:hypothetical protein